MLVFRNGAALVAPFLSFQVFGHGFPPGWRAHFLLFHQKKTAKEKATPGYAVGFADFPALLETGGGCGTRASPQTVLALCPPASPLLGAAHGALRSKAIPPAPRPTSRHSRVGGNLGGAWIPAYAGMTVQPLQLTSQQIAAVDLEKRQKIKTPHRTRTPCRAPWAALSNAGDREISACLFFAYFLLAKQKKVRRQQGGNPGQVTGIAIKTSRRHQHETHHPR